MSFRTASLIIGTAFVTVILMKNTDEVSFWIFGNFLVSKLILLGVTLGIGIIIGLTIVKPVTLIVDKASKKEEGDTSPDGGADINEDDRAYIN